jgi:steroid delta-isomerase-like uncharacterized protein
MSEENKAIQRRSHEDIWDKHNPDAVDEYYASDFINHSAPPGVPADREGLKGLIAMYFDAFPDLEVTNEFVLADGDKVIIRWNAKGTHTGPLGDIPATGNKIATRGISIAQISHGKIVGTWNESDQMDLMQQLGVIPALEKA